MCINTYKNLYLVIYTVDHNRTNQPLYNGHQQGQQKEVYYIMGKIRVGRNGVWVIGDKGLGNLKGIVKKRNSIQG